MQLDVADRLAIHELAARYGRIIDDRDWGRLDEVFSSDAVFRTEGFDATKAATETEGLEAIRRMLQASRHPVAHHVTNVEVLTDETAVSLYFKVVGPGPRGRVGSADYRDELVRTPGGWRIRRHVATLRRPHPPVDPPSGQSGPAVV